MHFVLWGTSQLGEGQNSQNFPKFQCTSCFGVLLNNPYALNVRNGYCFNALRALGYFSTCIFVHHRCSCLLFQCTSCFGVLLNERFSAQFPKSQLFQCTSCFGVLLNFPFVMENFVAEGFNALRALGYFSTLARSMSYHGERFNALRALGYFSTTPMKKWKTQDQVSLHCVLWGSGQRRR